MERTPSRKLNRGASREPGRDSSRDSEAALDQRQGRSRGVGALLRQLHTYHQPQLFRVLLGASIVLILAIALQAPTGLPTMGWDKLNHALAFACLTWLACAAFPGRLRWVVLGLLIYGGLIEWLQSLTTYRDAEAMDLLADAAGMGIALALGFGARALARAVATSSFGRH